MEVSGRRHAGSDDTNTGLVCDPCKSAGDTENAENYCVDCHEFLCFTCAKVHRRQAISKGHHLLGRDEMPKKKSTLFSENTCTKHDGRPFDYFCKKHNVLCCSVCLNLDHRQCAAEYITDLVKRFERSGEYDALCTRMRNLNELIGETKSRTDRNIAASKRLADQLVSDIKNFKAEINTYLDSLEKQVIEKVDHVKNEDIQETSASAGELDTMKSELDVLTSKLEELSKLNRKKDLVIATMLNKTHVSIIENRVGKLTEQSTVKQLKFCRNDRILDMLQATGIGSLEEITQSYRKPLVKKKIDKAVTQTQPLKVNHERNVDIKHKEDKTDCNVTGSVMMDTGRLAIADWGNVAVKVIDVQHGNILSCTKLSSCPRDITYTDQNQLVVTAPVIQTLIFLDVGKILTVNKELKVDGRCHGIDYTDNKLIVSFIDPGSVKILNMDGLVISAISNDPNGKPLFLYPDYVLCSADSSAIYVSDRNQNTISKLDMTGRVIFKYTNNECMDPRGIVADLNENLYIAGYESSAVCILSAEGRLNIMTKIDRPRSVALCEDTDQLFVSHGHESSTRNTLSVYKIH